MSQFTTTARPHTLQQLIEVRMSIVAYENVMYIEGLK